jgi:redox-sensing transcriptional repressor
MAMKKNIPEATVRRLSAYLRKLEDLAEKDVEHVSSRELAEHIKVGPEMTRRDLGMFGQFGNRGKGYGVEILQDKIRGILGTKKEWDVALVGVGDLGRALIRYPLFSLRGFKLIAAFDSDPKKIGTTVAGIEIHSMEKMKSILTRRGVRLAILTVPPQAAEQIAWQLSEAGISGILDFSSAVMVPAHGTIIDHVDISSHLEYLSFRVGDSRPRKQNKKRSRKSD